MNGSVTAVGILPFRGVLQYAGKCGETACPVKHGLDSGNRSRLAVYCCGGQERVTCIASLMSEHRRPLDHEERVVNNKMTFK